jgi:serine/threonine-protein kinase
VAAALKEKEDRKGKKVGPYRFLGIVGKGGMAVVHRGLHETLERDVAIKELLPQAAADKDTMSRFRREALALATSRSATRTSSPSTIWWRRAAPRS